MPPAWLPVALRKDLGRRFGLNAPVTFTGRRPQRYRAKESALGLAFMAPALAVFAVFSFLPFWRIVSWGTFESRQGGTRYEQVGLKQYGDVLTGDSFKEGVWHSALYVVFTLP